MTIFDEHEAAEEKELNEQIEAKIAEIAAVADQLPGIVIIHDIRGLVVKYMSHSGLRILGLALEKLKEMGPDYHVKFFNPEDSKDYAPLVFGLIERNIPGETIAFFQQVRPSVEHPWVWYACNVKVLLRNAAGLPILIISLVFPANPAQCESSQVKRLLEEKEFVSANTVNFCKLTAREKEILRQLVLGKSDTEVAKIMAVSEAVVGTCRKSIKKKLQTNSFAVLCQYANLFGLV